MMEKDRWVLFRDIRFWIGVFFILRLIGITNPPLETNHNWRQSLTNMTARIFHEEGADLMHPKVYYGGTQSSVIASEFPIFNYLIYLVSVVFGYEHWLGRIVNLLISSFGTWFLFRLLNKVFNKEVAFLASILFLSSIWFSYSRKIMPDTFSVSVVIIGLYYGWNWLLGAKNIYLFLYGLCISIGVLSKIPAITLIAPLGLTLFSNSISIKRKGILYAVSVCVVGIVSYWYFYWVPHLKAEGANDLFFTRGFSEGLKELWGFRIKLLDKLTFSPLQSHSGYLTVLAGIVLAIYKKHTFILAVAGSMLVVFGVFMVLAGSVFAVHNYYIIPIVPLFILLAAYALSNVPKRYRYILLAIICLECIANQVHDFSIKKEKLYPLELAALLDAHTPHESAIVINGGQSPQPLYFAHRFGWTVSPDATFDETEMNTLALYGVEFLVIDKYRQSKIPAYGEVLHDGKHYVIMKLK